MIEPWVATAPPARIARCLRGCTGPIGVGMKGNGIAALIRALFQNLGAQALAHVLLRALAAASAGSSSMTLHNLAPVTGSLMTLHRPYAQRSPVPLTAAVPGDNSSSIGAVAGDVRRARNARGWMRCATPADRNKVPNGMRA